MELRYHYCTQQEVTNLYKCGINGSNCIKEWIESRYNAIESLFSKSRVYFNSRHCSKVEF